MDRQVENFRKSVEAIKLPEELDLIIADAVDKGKRERKRRKSKRMFKKFALSAAAVLVFFTISVNTMPVFANYVQHIPVVSNLAQLLQFDKGIQGALKNEHYQEINRSVIDNGIEFGINRTVFDDKQITMDYYLRAQTGYYKDLTNLLIGEYTITDREGTVLADSNSLNESELSLSTESVIPENFTEVREIIGTMWLRFLQDGNKFSKMPAPLYLNVSKMVECASAPYGKDGAFYKEHERLPLTIDGHWTIPLNLDQELLVEPESYEHIEATAGDIKLVVEYLRIYPTVTEMKVSFDPASQVKLSTEFIDFSTYLEDGDENIYGPYIEVFRDDKAVPTITGIYGSYESSYFSESRDLYLVIKGKVDEETLEYSEIARIKIK
ncbi:DUF4179 domain-containing protein [Desulfolucanica intricata]|uniref:DUF4179 domain-containing protein n=1 Tax=Desulfolucanica intricata TaxID=1285191 RepID=UPI00082B069D|nr:DUF4179 domain-containing protein [Desulfolucanica intricata]